MDKQREYHELSEYNINFDNQFNAIDKKMNEEILGLT